MGVLVYSPEVQLVVAAQSGFYDVSDDIVSGSCTLIENNSHQMSCVLMNKGRRYDKLFKPNDRFALYLKRLSKLLIMTGYLDTVPFYSAWPHSIQIAGSSTLKRLQMHYWDPTTVASQNLFNSANGFGPTAGDNLIQTKALALLHTVGGWPKSQIHFGALPSQWRTKINALADIVFPQLGLPSGMPTFNGKTPFTDGLTTTSLFQNQNAIAGTGLPTSFATAIPYQGAQDIQSLSSWYCQMEWGYQNPDGSTPANISPSAVKTFLQGQKLMIGSPDSGTAVIVEIAGWGPQPASNAAIGLSTDALNALALPAASPQVEIAWVTNPTSIGVGPYNPATQATVNSTGVPTFSLPSALTYQDQVPGISVPPPAVNPLQYNNPQSAITLVSHGDTSYNINFTGQTESAEAKQAVAFAMNQLGAPYAWGATGPYAVGYDCSGLCYAAWQSAGITIPRTTYVQWPDLAPLPNEPASWLPGDLVYYDFNGQPNSPDHVKMFIGVQNGVYKTIEAPTKGEVVQIQDLDTSYDGARRVIANGSTSSGSSASGSSSSSGSSSTGAASGNGASGSSSFLSTWAWFANSSLTSVSNSLSGYRALMNDVPLLPMVQQVINASMRNFCSAPNGDLIAWFPDYFNLYNTLGVIKVQDIELQAFTIDWSDLTMVTHQYAAGTYNATSTDQTQIGGVTTTSNKIQTGGVATIDFPAILQDLFSLNPNDPTFSTEGIYNRFGARPDFQSLGVITGAMAEFWYAIYLFQKNWSSQFAANVPLVFLPELYPGMILQVASQSFQVYVSQVTHTWDLTSSGSFQTQATVTAPSSTGGGGFYGLAKGGNWGP